MGWLLFVDTSLIGVQASLVSPAGELVWRGDHLERGRGGRDLAPLVARGLASQGLRLAEVAGIGVGVGPGSFTGIKLALSWVAGVSAASEGRTRILGLSPLGCVCRRWAAGEEQAAVLLAATPGKGYLAHSRGGEPAELSRFDLGMALPEGPLWVSEDWQGDLPAAGRRIPVPELAREALLAMEAEGRRRAWEAWSQEPPKPLYLRRSTPEERLSGDYRDAHST